MSDAVCFAPMIPARRAVCSGSPLATLPIRISESAAALIVISPRASASRLVTGFAPTSTMRALPLSSTCDSRAAGRGRRLATLLLPLGQIEGQAFERDRQINTLQLDVLRYFQRTRREVQNRLHPGADDLVHNRLRMWRGHGDHGDIEPLAAHHLLELLDVVDRHPAA